MKLPLFRIDAFAGEPFQGNPAMVVLLEAWLPDALLQAIAAEIFLPETAFLVREGDAWRVRWFTPEQEMDLCGHATLASACVIFQELRFSGGTIRFASASGELRVTRSDDWLWLDFPNRPATPCETPEGLFEALGIPPRAVARARDHLVMLESERAVAALRPDFRALDGVESEGVIVTAPGDRVDFVSRFFTPRAAIPEDPVTGSAHCTLIPWWAERLGKLSMRARQISARGGDLACELKGDRVAIGGRAVLVARGEFLLAD